MRREDDPAAVARREIAELKERREVVSGLDEVDRAMAEADLDEENDADLRRLRRYEAALHSRIRRCLARLKYKSPHRTAHPSLVIWWAEPAVPPVQAAHEPPKAEALPAHPPPKEFR